MGSKAKRSTAGRPDFEWDDEHPVDRAANHRIGGPQALEEGAGVLVREVGIGPNGPIREAIFVPAGVRRLGEAGFDYMAAMQAYMRTIGQAYDELAETVDMARQAGMSWEAIGFCTGYTATGARKRWGGDGEDDE